MADGDIPVTVRLVWSEPAALRVEAHEDGLHVTAHAGLSEAQVRAACDQLDEHGDHVFRAWQGAVGRQ